LKSIDIEKIEMAIYLNILYTLRNFDGENGLIKNQQRKTNSKEIKKMREGGLRERGGSALEIEYLRKSEGE